MTKIKLNEIAHARSGDKGDTLIISLIPYDEKHYAILKEKLTEELVMEHFSDMVKGKVVRYEVDNIQAFNFVFYEALDGGVTQSLRLDAHGKTLSSKLLDLEIDILSE
jgi:hypothetical protein